MGCFRTSLAPVSIFACDRLSASLHLKTPLISPDSLQLERTQAFEDRFTQFATAEVRLDFPVPFSWSIDETSACVLNWLLSPTEMNQFSMVGVMSSTRFLLLIQAYLGKQLAGLFKVLIFATSTFRNASHFQSTGNLAALLPFAQFAGARLLKQLEQHVNPRRFGKLSVGARLALFLYCVEY
jgi:hypothetical protein